MRSRSARGAAAIHRRQEAARFRGVAQPLALLGHEDVRVVEAGRRAVDAAQLLDGLEGVGRGFRGRAADERRRQRPQVVVGDAVRARRQRRVAGRRRAERVDARGQMAVAADRLGQVGGADDARGMPKRPTGAPAPAAGRRSVGVHDCKGLSGGRIDRLGILPVLLVQLEDVSGVYSRELLQIHNLTM